MDNFLYFVSEAWLVGPAYLMDFSEKRFFATVDYVAGMGPFNNLVREGLKGLFVAVFNRISSLEFRCLAPVISNARVLNKLLTQ